MKKEWSTPVLSFNRTNTDLDFLSWMLFYITRVSAGSLQSLWTRPLLILVKIANNVKRPIKLLLGHQEPLPDRNITEVQNVF